MVQVAEERAAVLAALQTQVQQEVAQQRQGMTAEAVMRAQAQLAVRTHFCSCS